MRTRGSPSITDPDPGSVGEGVGAGWRLVGTWAARREVAALRAGRGDCGCIGTSLDAQGFRGRVTAPGPDFSDAGSRVLREPQRAMAPSAQGWAVGPAARPIGGALAGTAKLRQRTCRDVRAR